ncbi:MAG: sulfatase-like hydrolase/transferase [Anaerolineae bacterium]|nr:sulfatase-like hydrolase/transferase [Anaerolineae bacterium]
MTSSKKLTGPEYVATQHHDPNHPITEPPNIIIINADTYRYDNLFDRAAMPVRTPNLDAFSARAVSMERFYTGSFPTIPERTDLISGRYGWPWYGWKPLTEKNLMPKLLQERGYVTQLLCDCPHLFNTDFHKVFNGAYAIRGQEGDTFFLRMNAPVQEMMPREKTRTGHHFQDKNLVDLHRWINRYWVCEDDTFPPRTAATAVRWLEENAEYRPFFLWVDFFDPHEPWDPPEYMVKKYDPDYTGTPMLHPNYGKASDYTPEELCNLRAHYCAEAELVDRWVGRIFQKVDDMGLWDNTIVIFTTDHGMSLGEHNRTGKSNINDNDDRRWPLYADVAHIPFLIAAPGLAGGRAVDLLAQPVDILPTLLDLTGLDVTPPVPFHGQSFASALRGETQSPLHDFVITGSHLRKRDGAIPHTAVTPVLYTEKWAYAPIGPDSERELFDLDADPLTETNVITDHLAVAADLHANLIAWLRDLDAPDEAIEVYL